MTQKTKPYELFTRATEKLQLSAPDLSEALGYSRSASHVWKKSGEMPKVACLACEGLIRRAGIKDKTKVLYIVPVTARHIDAFTSFCKALGISFAKLEGDL